MIASGTAGRIAEHEHDSMRSQSICKLATALPRSTNAKQNARLEIQAAIIGAFDLTTMESTSQHEQKRKKRNVYRPVTALQHIVTSA